MNSKQNERTGKQRICHKCQQLTRKLLRKALKQKSPILSGGRISQEKGRILDMIPTYDLLILDDFGIERTTEYCLEFIFSVVDARYQSRKPVIVTTNLSLKTLRSPRDLEHQRIYDRILEMCIPVFFVGKDYRKEVQKTKYLSFQNLYHEEN